MNLALTTRPQCFSEILGQELTISQTINHLDNILKEPNDLIQPIILSGPRGTGKTSTARLIGQYLNCINNERDTTKPCDCTNCMSLRNNPESNFDYVELDAATHNGVADIEKIVDSTFYAPLNGFKIIVLDEAHMLSRQAFNKLLKQLEEPPKKVLYILATTEEHKIIETVISRCKIRHFNLIADEEIYINIQHIINNPNLVSNTSGLDDEEIIKYIVSIAKGSMRDAIKTLDEILDLDDRTLLNIRQTTGSADIKKLGTLLKFLFNKRIGDVLIELHKLEKNGVDAKKLMEQLQFLLSDLLNVKSGAAITRFLSVDYYKEKFDTTINISDVCNVLGSLIETEGIARNISFHTLTYALVKCCEVLSILIVEPIENDFSKPLPVLSYNQPSNVNLQKNTTTADKLAQILSAKRNEEKPVKIDEVEEDDDEALF